MVKQPTVGCFTMLRCVFRELQSLPELVEGTDGSLAIIVDNATMADHPNATYPQLDPRRANR